MGGVQSPSHSMDVLTQPAEHGSHIPCGDVFLRGTDLALHGLGKLSTDQMPEQVRREIPEETFAPVDVLETALCIARRLNPQELLVAKIPFTWEILHRESLLNKK